MKKLSLPVLLGICCFTSTIQAQNICVQQFSAISVNDNTNNITVAGAEGIVADILNVMGLKGNFEVRAAKVSNAAAMIYNGKRYLLYNPVFISTLNNATGNDWASVSVLAHEIGHHLNGHTLNGGSEPGRELEADEFSGYIMQRLGASLEEAETAMKLAADVKGTATHPGRTDRINSIEQGWNRASDQLAADIEANTNENDSAVISRPATIAAVEKDAAPAVVKEAAFLLREHDIIANVYFDEASNGQYYLTSDGSLVGISENRLFWLGQLKDNSSNEFPYVIDNTYERLYINGTGAIVDSTRLVVGRISKLNRQGK